jgi:ferritin-like metal-binding protein YciE
MAEAASAPELKQAFTKHLEETKNHAEMVKQMLSSINESAGGEKCKGMEGLLEEGKEILTKRGDNAVKDAALIAAAQRVEHYEIAGYGTARTFALQLGNNEAVNRLQEILNQEAKTDELLTKLATGEGAGVAINQEAADGNSSSKQR